MKKTRIILFCFTNALLLCLMAASIANKTLIRSIFSDDLFKFVIYFLSIILVFIIADKK